MKKAPAIFAVLLEPEIVEDDGFSVSEDLVQVPSPVAKYPPSASHSPSHVKLVEEFKHPSRTPSLLYLQTLVVQVYSLLQRRHNPLSLSAEERMHSEVMTLVGALQNTVLLVLLSTLFFIPLEQVVHIKVSPDSEVSRVTLKEEQLEYPLTALALSLTSMQLPIFTLVLLELSVTRPNPVWHLVHVFASSPTMQLLTERFPLVLSFLRNPSETAVHCFPDPQVMHLFEAVQVSTAKVVDIKLTITNMVLVFIYLNFYIALRKRSNFINICP